MGRILTSRQSHDKRRATAQHAAALHRACHRLSQFFHDGKPKPGGGFTTGRLRGESGEFAEHFLLILRADARPLIFDTDANAALCDRHRHQNGGFERRKFDRVGDQVVEDLHRSVAISAPPRLLAFLGADDDLFSRSVGLIVRGALRRERPEFTGRDVRGEFPLLNRIGIQKVFDEVQHPLPRAKDVA